MDAKHVDESLSPIYRILTQVAKDAPYKDIPLKRWNRAIARASFQARKMDYIGRQVLKNCNQSIDNTVPILLPIPRDRDLKIKLSLENQELVDLHTQLVAPYISPQQTAEFCDKLQNNSLLSDPDPDILP